MSKPIDNPLHPGLPDYTGPTKGWFLLLHHDGHLLGWSDDVMERIDYIIREKPASERATRLRHIVFVPESKMPKRMLEVGAAHNKARATYDKASAAYDKAWIVFDKARAARDKARAAYSEASAAYSEAWDAYDTSKSLLAYLHEHVPDCKWDGQQIVFTPQ